jgi:hypothetical protein
MLKLTKNQGYDAVGAVEKTIPVYITHTNLLGGEPFNMKSLHFVDAFSFALSRLNFTFYREYSSALFTLLSTLTHKYTLEWGDITWSDITWQETEWQLQCVMPFGGTRCQWCGIRVGKDDATYQFSYYGLVLWFTAHKQLGVFA